MRVLHEAIEQAAAETARAAALASLGWELAAVSEAQRLQGEYSRVKTSVVTDLVCFLGGLTIGTGGVMIIQGAR
jgi:hypothetical protein